MKLPFTLPFGKKEQREYFLSLLLREEKLNAVIFEEIAGKVRVVGEGEKQFLIEGASTDELLEALDEVISKAESNLPENVETQKTIFGLKENWVQGSTIKKDYLATLKKISDTLGLRPIGFLVIQEAIAHLMQKEEGAPVSAILVEIGKQNLAVSLLRAGRLLETKRTKLDDDIAKTTDRMLHHFTNYEVLPSRIVIFDDDQAEELSQEFIGHTWSKSLPFLHVPQIMVLPLRFDAKAVLFGAAAQMGFEILGTPPHEESYQTSTEKHKGEQKQESFGFVKDHDIAEKKTVEKKMIATPQPQTRYASVFAKVKSIISLALQNVQHIGTFPTFSSQRKILFVPLILAAFLIVLLLLYIFKLQAEVVLSFTPKALQETQTVTFSIDKPTDASSGRIQTALVDTEEEGTVSTKTTGTKEVGEKAKGTVTIYNSSLNEGRTFPKATIITSSNSLEFVTDTGVSVASASGDASDIQSSNTKVSITAKDIGKEYNLPSGTKFSVGNLSTTAIIAKNDSAFAGGSKKEITVVDKKDVDTLLVELPKKLEEKARQSIEKQIPSHDASLPIFESITITKQDVSKDIGEEADSITLAGTVRFRAITYAKKDLDSLAKAVLSIKQQDMLFSDEGITYSVEKVTKKTNKDTQATLILKASLIPKVDTQKLSEKIAGKSFDEAQSLLLQLPQSSDVRVKLLPNIPFLPKVLPRISKNITFSIATHD